MSTNIYLNNRMQSNKIYEVYVYCDPRYPGPYKYGNYSFSYKPIYVGKGSQKWHRRNVHSNRSSNSRLKKTIYKLKKNNLIPIIVTIVKAVTEKTAYNIEKSLINIIGRADKGLGPLFNFTNGGEGQSGRFFSREEKNKRSINSKKYFNSLTPEQLKQHGQKSLINRDPFRVRMGTLQANITKSNKPLSEKKRLEEQRFLSWKKAYYSRSIEQKKITSAKCAIANSKKLQYFITIYNLNTGITDAKFLIDWIKDGYARDGIMCRIKNNSSEVLFSRTKKQHIQIINAEMKSPFSVQSLSQS